MPDGKRGCRRGEKAVGDCAWSDPEDLTGNVKADPGQLGLWPIVKLAFERRG